ncbi:MAG: hypothetical protein GEU90_16570 [Gemmatimonas sp.]|nr:hypothetical protein [Gemmatimonas sp.]
MHAEALICSHPRSGGRWLRFLVAHYLAARYHLDIRVSPRNVFSVIPDHHEESSRGYPAFGFSDRRVPLIAVCHQPYRWDLHRGYPTIFLARNPYDVVVSAYYYLQEKEQQTRSMRDFIHHSRLGLSAWIEYMNIWSPKLLNHRDATFISYASLDAAAGKALQTVLDFLDHEPEPQLIGRAVWSAAALRSSHKIRTGQEGNFWDHLQPEDIFDIQERVHHDLSDFSTHLLASIGVEIDPFPRADQ